MRRVTFWLGLVMLVAGLALLGYVGWQFWGTNWTSHRQQQPVTQDLREGVEPAGATLKRQPQFVPRARPRR